MGQEFTVNYLLSMEKSLRQRLNQLNELKNEVARRYRYDDKVDEPTYDIKLVDKKITDINRALFMIDHKVKESNAKTSISVDVNYASLMSEIA